MNRDSIRGRSLYKCMSEGNLLSLKKFRWYVLFSSASVQCILNFIRKELLVY